MVRSAAALVVLMVISSIAAAATNGATGAEISQRSIAGLRLGLTVKQVVSRFGKPYLTSRGTFDNPGQPENYARLAFPKRKVAAYFQDGTDKAIIVTTWSKAYRTAAGVGPCSTLAQVQAAYRSTLKPSKRNRAPDGTIYGYVVGKNLLFAFDGRPPNPSPTVTAVGLYDGRAPVKENTLGYAGFVTLSEPNC